MMYDNNLNLKDLRLTTADSRELIARNLDSHSPYLADRFRDSELLKVIEDKKEAYWLHASVTAGILLESKEKPEILNSFVSKLYANEVNRWYEQIQAIKGFNGSFIERQKEVHILEGQNLPTVIVARDRDSAADIAASYISEFTKNSISSRKHIIFATGNTMKPVLDKLVSDKWFVTDKLQLVTHLDEYLGVRQQDSFKHFLEEYWNKLNIPENKRYAINVKQNIEDLVRRIDALHDNLYLNQSLGLCIMGIGPKESPHIAFLDNQKELFTDTQVVNLSEATIKRDDSPYSQAVTVGTRTILKTSAQLMVFYGTDKADGFVRSIGSDFNPAYPAATAKFAANRWLIVADNSAGDKLNDLYQNLGQASF